MNPLHKNSGKEKENSARAQERVAIPLFSADEKQGLSSAQAAERMEAGWDNQQVDASSKTVKEIIVGNLCTYFNLIFLIISVLLCLVGAFRNLTFLPVIIANTLIGIVQEIRAKQVLDKMNILAVPKATVIRDGQRMVLPAEELVRDDIVVFQAGNQICADAKVVAGEVQVNESLLTGEADEITKGCGASLISGSFVVAGECCARLTAVGRDSYISQLTLEAKATKSGVKSEMIRSLNELLVVIGILLIPISIALFVQSYFLNEETLAKSVTATAAAVIGMIPEGLYLLTSVALAVSSIRLARKNVLLHDMESIETLARVDVLCVDKTGTITENTMQVKKLVALEPMRMEELSLLIGDFALAMSNDNTTMEAIKMHFTKGTGKKPLKVVPFSSTVKYSAVAFEDGVYVLGAPEFVLREDFSSYEEQISSYTAKGYRLLVFGRYRGEANGGELTERVELLGYLMLANPIRKAAPETFSYFAEQGVAVKVISGDNPLTVVEAAKEAHIEGAERYVDARTLVTEEDVDRALRECVVFGRVTPEQKRLFVRILKRQGRTVAMTGDGVNDVLALKDADCSVAMASGSEAAAQASQVVLLDSDFSCMPQVVLEGRRVVNNIQRSASLFLVKNIFSILLSLFSLVSSLTYPLEASQISLVSMFTIGIPGFFLALQPNHARIEGRFLPNVLLKALPAGLTDMIAVGALAIFGEVFGVDATDISTAATMLLAIVGFMILYKIIRPSNVMHWCVWFGSIAGFILFSVFLSRLYGIYDMSVKCIMLLVVFSIATESLFRTLTVWEEKLQALYQRLRRRKV